MESREQRLEPQANLGYTTLSQRINRRKIEMMGQEVTSVLEKIDQEMNFVSMCAYVHTHIHKYIFYTYNISSKY